MLETSRDVLNLVIGFSILWIALWLSWILYHIGKTLKGVNKTVTGVQKIVDSLQDGIKTMKSKTNSAAAYFTVLLKSGQQFLKLVQKKKTPRKRTKKQK